MKELLLLLAKGLRCLLVLLLLAVGEGCRRRPRQANSPENPAQSDTANSSVTGTAPQGVHSPDGARGQGGESHASTNKTGSGDGEKAATAIRSLEVTVPQKRATGEK